MKITREVRDFAAKPNSESYLASAEGMRGVEASDQDAETGMAQMSEAYREKGEKLYLSE